MIMAMQAKNNVGDKIEDETNNDNEDNIFYQVDDVEDNDL